MRTLRVGFDGRALTSPAPGIRRYTRNLLVALAALSDEVELVVLGGSSVAVPDGIHHLIEQWNPKSNIGWASFGLPRIVWRSGIDVLHSPAYTAPLLSTKPVVLTIHDVSYARYPEWYPYRRDVFRRAFYHLSARKASAVITDSEFSASEIRAAYSLPDSLINVIPLGVDPVFTRGDESKSSVLPHSVMLPYVLHVGDLHERRNLSMLVDAVLAARKHLHNFPLLSLVLVGSDRGIAKQLNVTDEWSNISPPVIHFDTVNEKQLLALYRQAAMLAYPSFYEGFGLPVLEAMACGIPVVASHAASIPEVLGDTGILLDPNDLQGWTKTMIDLVDNKSEQQRLGELGRSRSKEFTWERAARATLDVYRRVYGT